MKIQLLIENKYEKLETWLFIQYTYEKIIKTLNKKQL